MLLIYAFILILLIHKKNIMSKFTGIKEIRLQNLNLKYQESLVRDKIRNAPYDWIDHVSCVVAPTDEEIEIIARST